MTARRIGVCSWSLRPRDVGELVERARACGVLNVQLALDPVRRGEWDEGGTVAALRGAGMTVISGMMTTIGEDYSTLETIRETGGLRPARHWDENLKAARANAELASRLGVRLVTLHAGFLPHERSDPERGVMMGRLRAVADVFAACGVTLGLETGQETAATLVGVLKELGRANVGVNFDPANMILYGMGDPVAALRELSAWVKQVHIKDASAAERAGVWGAERAAGRGDVAWGRFFETLRTTKLNVGLVIEREDGESRVEDVRTAREMIERYARVDGSE